MFCGLSLVEVYLSGNMHGCPRATSSDISEMTWDQGWKVDDVPYRHKGGGSPSVNEDNQRILTTVFIAFVFIVSPYRVFPTLISGTTDQQGTNSKKVL